MKATLEFYLPRENTEYTDAVHGARYRAAITDCLEALRINLKHGDLEEGTRGGIEMAQRELYAACSENGFDPWEDMWPLRRSRPGRFGWATGWLRSWLRT